ncbi:hypothetical protein [Streptomyces spirodelae]|uniref:Acyl-CoA carboxylase subunit epsilon n=1 Tax=Streptomyces spirodelae TaxID=2812904 RepID=A0ABS3WPK9_9ACTN|nr:hypothetical protein [Streptomyces spirodelae]MBO8185035.1 hypothetical protein [Streptomyces spirodelae]
MPTDPFRAIAALARAEAVRTTTPVPPEPRTSSETAEPEKPEVPDRRRTGWREIARRIRRPRSS